MSLVSIFLVYLMVWMIVFFMSLPIGINVSRNLELGNANSAPTKTHLKLKVLLCTIVSFFPTYLSTAYTGRKFFYFFSKRDEN